MLRIILLACFALITAAGLRPPETGWLIVIGLAGFIGSLFISKDA